MKSKKTSTIRLFVASGSETKPIRDKVVLELQRLSRIHENTGFDFEVLWWENQSGTIPSSGRSQDTYNKLINESDMVAVIIKNSLGKYTYEEFNHAIKVYKENGEYPKVVVYVLPTTGNNKERHDFLNSLRLDEYDYFYVPVDNDDKLIHEITIELLTIMNDYIIKKELGQNDENKKDIKLNDEFITKIVKKSNSESRYSNISIDEVNKQLEIFNIITKYIANFFLHLPLSAFNIDNKKVAQVETRTHQRIEYYNYFHDVNINQTKESAIRAYWILKYKPFSYGNRWNNDADCFDINSIFALYFLLSSVITQINLKIKHEKIKSSNEFYIIPLYNFFSNHLRSLYLHTFNENDVSLETFILIAETIYDLALKAFNIKPDDESEENTEK